MWKIFERFITKIDSFMVSSLSKGSNRPVRGIKPKGPPPPLPPPMNEVLATELNFFNQHREEWYKHHGGKIALIKGTVVYGFFDNYKNALSAGYNKLGITPFLITEVRLKGGEWINVI